MGTGAADHEADKRLLAAMLADLADAPDPRLVLDRYCVGDCLWRVFHPFGDFRGGEAVAKGFWAPLRAALPDHEHRPAFLLAGEYGGRPQVSSWGVLMGTFENSWLGIPPTHRPATLRFGVVGTIADGRFTRVHVLLDIPDVMRQAGVYPFRTMPGSVEAWAFPPPGTGASASACDPALGAESLRVVREMQLALPRPDEVAMLSQGASRHSHHWHPRMNWYGPAGIGSSRGERGFRDVHGALFLQAFPDRAGFPPTDGADEDAPGHFVAFGDGRYAVTCGWPALHATHLGPEWLGLPPTGRRVEMRIADWYRIDGKGLIVDNWVMIDVPHVVFQMGLDIFHDLQWTADPARPRWPEPRIT